MKICGKRAKISMKNNLIVVEFDGEIAKYVTTSKNPPIKALYSIPDGKYLGMYDVDLGAKVTIPPGGGFSVSMKFPIATEIYVDNSLLIKKNCSPIKRTYIGSIGGIGGYVLAKSGKNDNIKIVIKNLSSEKIIMSDVVIPAVVLSIDENTGVYDKVYVNIHSAAVEFSNKNNYEKGILLPKSFIF